MAMRRLQMAQPVLQLALETRSGARAPLATCRDQQLVRLVAEHILAEARSARYEDPTLAELARAETEHVANQLRRLGVEVTP